MVGCDRQRLRSAVGSEALSLLGAVGYPTPNVDLTFGQKATKIIYITDGP